MAKRRSYHHGDLRNALLQAALTMVDEIGLEQLSLRKVAASVGVSHAAPKHHFGDVKGKTIIPGFIDMHAHHYREHAGILPSRSSETAIYLAKSL